MRTFRYDGIGPDGLPVDLICTEADILATWYPSWALQMARLGRAPLATPEACVEDWVVTHWAWEVAHDGD